MISEREEYEFKDGGTLVLTNGENGVTVEIDLGKPMKGTYNDMRKLVPTGQVSDIFTNIIKVAYLMQITDFLKVNIKIEAI